jgi:hypothetical protein
MTKGGAKLKEPGATAPGGRGVPERVSALEAGGKGKGPARVQGEAWTDWWVSTTRCSVRPGAATVTGRDPACGGGWEWD